MKAFAILSTMFLVAAISGVTLIASAEGSANVAHSFIGTQPDASTIEVQPPTF